MKAEKINQQWVDNLKSQPISTQVLEILKVLDSDVDILSIRPMLIQFSDLLIDIQIANKAVGNNGDFFQARVDEVIRMRGLK